MREREGHPGSEADVTLDELRAWRKARIDAEGGPLFMRIPDRWYEKPGPKFRCTNGHVSTSVLKSSLHGDLCLGCMEHVLMTFPEDVDDPGAT